jgi:hypothetical protein
MLWPWPLQLIYYWQSIQYFKEQRGRKTLEICRKSHPAAEFIDIPLCNDMRQASPESNDYHPSKTLCSSFSLYQFVVGLCYLTIWTV